MADATGPPGVRGRSGLLLFALWSRMTAGFSLPSAKMQTESAVRYSRRVSEIGFKLFQSGENAEGMDRRF